MRVVSNGQDIGFGSSLVWKKHSSKLWASRLHQGSIQGKEVRIDGMSFALAAGKLGFDVSQHFGFLLGNLYLCSSFFDSEKACNDYTSVRKRLCHLLSYLCMPTHTSQMSARLGFTESFFWCHHAIRF